MSYVIKAHEQGSSLLLHYSQDVEPILNDAARSRRFHAEQTSFAKRGEFRRIFSISPVILMDICQKHHLNFYDSHDAKKIMKILKRPEYKLFRTTNDKRI